jgi:hypothetical protein
LSVEIPAVFNVSPKKLVCATYPEDRPVAVMLKRRPTSLMYVTKSSFVKLLAESATLGRGSLAFCEREAREREGIFSAATKG